MIVCRYGSAQPKRVLVQKKKNTKRTVEDLLANQYGMMFFPERTNQEQSPVTCIVLEIISLE